MTRRWILELGGAAVLTGFSGADLSAAEPLPPGLYGPSLNHLAHALKLAQGSFEYGPPRFFAPRDIEVLRRTIATMLDWEPEQAPVAEIAAWIDLLLSEAPRIRAARRNLSPAHRAVAIAYGEQPEAHPEEAFTLARFRDPSFLDAPRAQQIALLETWEAAGDPSVLWLKRRVIEGFYTSRQGLAELNYKGNAFYPESPGCGH